MPSLNVSGVDVKRGANAARAPSDLAFWNRRPGGASKAVRSKRVDPCLQRDEHLERVRGSGCAVPFPDGFPVIVLTVQPEREEVIDALTSGQWAIEDLGASEIVEKDLPILRVKAEVPWMQIAVRSKLVHVRDRQPDCDIATSHRSRPRLSPRPRLRL